MSAIAIFDIDGVLRDVTNSYRRALADTVEFFTNNLYRPSMEDIDNLKGEGIWNNDWEGSQELIYRFFEQRGKTRDELGIDYHEVVDFFQRRYRGQVLDNPSLWDGYITQEPLLVDSHYFSNLTNNSLYWGFFSGATRGSAEYILQQRLYLDNPLLIAMEDAPSKPNPQGLFSAIALVEERYNLSDSLPVIYLGDTVADMMTVGKAREMDATRQWVAIGVLPPHVACNEMIREKYTIQLLNAGANQVISKVTEFTNFYLA